MNVSEAKNIISHIDICRNTMSILQKNEKEPFFKDCFRMTEELLCQYKALLQEKIEKAEL